MEMVLSFTHRPIYPRRKSTARHSGRRVEEENICLHQESNPDTPVVRPLALEPYYLGCVCSKIQVLEKQNTACW
jgi:hypothetical protein